MLSASWSSMGKTQNRRNSIVQWRLAAVGGGWRLAVGGLWWLAVGGGNAHILGGVGACRRLQAQFTAPLAPCSLNNTTCRQCLQHADSVYNMQTVSTTCRQCLQHADSVYNMQTVSTTCRQCLQHADSVYNMQTVSTTCRQCLQHADSVYNMQTVSTTCRQCLQHADSVDNMQTVSTTCRQCLLGQTKSTDCMGVSYQLADPQYVDTTLAVGCPGGAALN